MHLNFLLPGFLCCLSWTTLLCLPHTLGFASAPIYPGLSQESSEAYRVKQAFLSPFYFLIYL